MMRTIEKQYIANIKKSLPMFNGRKTLLRDLYESVSTYCQENPSADLNDLYHRFGTPEEIAESINDVSMSGSEAVRKVLSIQIILIIMIAVFAFVCIFLVARYHKDSHINTVIQSSEDANTSSAINQSASSIPTDITQYQICNVGDTISVHFSAKGSGPQLTGYSIESDEFIPDGNSEATMEYTVEEAELFDNVGKAGLSQKDLDDIALSSQADWAKESTDHQFVVIKLRAKHKTEEEGMDSRFQTVHFNPSESFHLLTYAMLSKGFNYDPTPLVWCDLDDRYLKGSYYVYNDEDNNLSDTIFRIGFLLTDRIKTQDGILLCITSAADTNQYVDLDLQGIK